MEFENENIQSENPFVDKLMKNLKILAYNCIIKDEYTANRAETKESLDNAEVYMACVENRVSLVMFGQIPDQFLREVGLDEETIAVYKTFNGNVDIIPLDNESAGLTYRSRLVKKLRPWFLDNYEEKNEYYRKITGKPPLNDWGIPVRDYEKYLPDGFAYQGEFVHEIGSAACRELEAYGVLDIMRKDYPDAKYLDYVTAGINVYEARKSFDFMILWAPSNCDFNITEEFKHKYLERRDFLLRSVYNSAMEIESEYYHATMQVYLLITTMVDMLAETQTHIIKKDVLDRRCVEYLFSMYGVPYFKEIPYKYQERICMNLHNLIKYKSSSENFEIIKKIFDMDDVEFYRYFLVKRRKQDENGDFLWSGKIVKKSKLNDIVYSSSIYLPIKYIPDLSKDEKIPEDLEWNDSSSEVTIFEIPTIPAVTDNDTIHISESDIYDFTYLETENDDIYSLVELNSANINTQEIDPNGVVSKGMDYTDYSELSDVNGDIASDYVETYDVMNDRNVSTTSPIPKSGLKPDGVIDLTKNYSELSEDNGDVKDEVPISYDELNDSNISSKATITPSGLKETDGLLDKNFFELDDENGGIGNSYVETYESLTDENMSTEISIVPSGLKVDENISLTSIYDEMNNYNGGVADDEEDDQQEVFVNYSEMDDAINKTEVELDKTPLQIDKFSVNKDFSQMTDENGPVQKSEEVTYDAMDDNNIDSDNIDTISTGIVGLSSVMGHDFSELTDENGGMASSKTYDYNYLSDENFTTETTLASNTLDTDVSFTVDFSQMTDENGGFNVFEPISYDYLDDRNREEALNNTFSGIIEQDSVMGKDFSELSEENGDVSDGNEIYYDEMNDGNLEAIKEPEERKYLDLEIRYPFGDYLQKGNVLVVRADFKMLRMGIDYMICNYNYIRLRYSSIKNAELLMMDFYYDITTENVASTSKRLTFDLKEVAVTNSYIKIPEPFEDYIENDWPFFVLDENLRTISENSYDIIETELSAYPERDLKNKKYGDKLYFGFIYADRAPYVYSKFVEDYYKTTDLVFCKVPDKDKYGTKYLLDESRWKDYDIVVAKDGWWTGKDYKKNNYDLVKTAIYESSNNYMRSKYYGIGRVIELSSNSARMAFFYSALFDDVLKEENLTINVNSISSIHEFNIAHLILYMTCLTHIYNGQEDEILSSNSSGVMYASGFNYRASLEDIRAYIVNHHFDPENFPIFDMIIPDGQVSSFSAFMDIQKNNEEVYHRIRNRMVNAQDYREYEIWQYVYDTLMTWKYNQEYFRLSNGNIATTYTEFLKEKDSILYSSIMSVKAIKDRELRIDTIMNLIDDVCYMMEEYIDKDFSNHIFSEFVGHDTSSILNYMMKVVEFFKSVKIVFNERGEVMNAGGGGVKTINDDTVIQFNDCMSTKTLSRTYDYYNLDDEHHTKQISSVGEIQLNDQGNYWLREDCQIITKHKNGEEEIINV